MAATALSKLSSIDNLQSIWKEYLPRARGSSAGIDGITAKDFLENPKFRLGLIHKELLSGYEYSSLKGVVVPKKDVTKFRIICVPTIQDRLVQRGVLRAIEARGEYLGIINDVSFGFIKDTDTRKRGTSAARAAAVSHRKLRPWVFKADISAFFDTINREQLISEFSRAFKLVSLHPLISGAINCEVDSSSPRVKRHLKENGIVEGRGLRQGMPLSPILSNFVLRDFDKAFEKAGYDLVRYADDMIVMSNSKEECKAIEELTIRELQKVGLELSVTKTETRGPEEAVEFLGLELLPKKLSGYCLNISQEQISKIKEEFRKFNDIDYVIKKNLDITTLLRRLERMASGYRYAYGIADNYAILDEFLNEAPKSGFTKIYKGIFGPEVLKSLSINQRAFLKLD